MALRKAVKTALPQGMKTAVWLLKLTIPVSFVVFLLSYFGILTEIARVTDPVFKILGLPGQASIVLITSYFTNIYSVIAVMATLDLTIREGLILANMCLIAHALIVETGIQQKTGSSAWRMVMVRIMASFVAAWLLNLVLPAFQSETHIPVTATDLTFIDAFGAWFKTISVTAFKIVILVNLLLIIQKLLSELGVLEWLVKPFHPLLKIMGLPRETGFLWVVAYTLGLSYGGAVMISQTAEGKLNAADADLLNHHIAISHSQFEDSLLFVALGFSLFWIIFPRMLLAVVMVWLRRFELKSFRSKVV